MLKNSMAEARVNLKHHDGNVAAKIGSNCNDESFTCCTTWKCHGLTRNRFWREGLTCSFCQRPFPKPYGPQNIIGSQKDSSGTDRQSSGQRAESKKLADTMARLRMS